MSAVTAVLINIDFCTGAYFLMTYFIYIKKSIYSVLTTITNLSVLLVLILLCSLI